MVETDSLQEFISKYITCSGGRVVNFDGELMELEIPERLQKILDVSSRLKLVFCPERLEKEPDAEYLTAGSPLLDKILAMTRDRGQTSRFYLNPPIDFEKFDEMLSMLEFPNCQLSATVPRLVYYPHILFNFKVSYISDEKREQLESLMVDCLRGEISDKMDVLEHSTSETQSKEFFEREVKDVARAYDIACKEMRRRIQSQVNRFVFEANRRLQKELARLADYYAALQDEMQVELKAIEDKVVESYYKMKNARKVSTQEQHKKDYYRYRNELDTLRKEIDTKLEILEEEKERRVAEQREKYRPKVEIVITNTAIVQVPRLEQKMVLSNEFAERKINLLYDILRNEFLDFQCERCTDNLRKIYVCRNGHIVCSNCTKLCASCGQAVCKDCFMERCGICNQYVCPSCYKKCQSCGMPVCSEHGTVCSECGGTFCRNCTLQCEVCAATFCTEHISYCLRCDNPVCDRHSGKCDVCGETFCRDFILTCEVCNSTVCFRHGAECYICKKVCCREHMSRCVLCGTDVCAEHSGVCHVCGETYCRDHLNECVICLEQYCDFHDKRCSVCNQEYCADCVIEGECNTCRSLVKALPEDERLKTFKNRNDCKLNLKRFWRWEIAENDKYVILSGLNILRPYVFILFSNTLEVKEWYKGGFLHTVRVLLRLIK